MNGWTSELSQIFQLCASFPPHYLLHASPVIYHISSKVKFGWNFLVSPLQGHSEWIHSSQFTLPRASLCSLSDTHTHTQGPRLCAQKEVRNSLSLKRGQSVLSDPSRSGVLTCGQWVSEATLPSCGQGPGSLPPKLPCDSRPPFIPAASLHAPCLPSQIQLEASLLSKHTSQEGGGQARAKG